MSQKIREEMLPRLRQRYANRGLEGRSRMITELCEQFGYSRKHAIKLLGAKTGWGGDPLVRKGRPPVYGPEVVEVLVRIWKASEQPCGKRLVAMLALWLPYDAQEHGRLTPELHRHMLGISAVQVDRLLAPHKIGSRRGRCGTKPGGLLKHQIPIRTDNWDVAMPGYLEADTVAHCGDSLEGEFIWSVTYTDIYSGWTANRAVWNKGAAGVVDATRNMEQALPFAVLGFDCDNGSEFLNWHLVSYFDQREKKVGFTRSRPYHKNDNGHVEQKNWTHVRQLVGYGRFEGARAAQLLNALYAKYWSPFRNFFCPVMKHLRTETIGSRKRRVYDQPATPFERLKACPQADPEQIARLEKVFAVLDPFELKQTVETKLRALLRLEIRRSSSRRAA